MSSSIKGVFGRYPLRMACCVVALGSAVALYYISIQIAEGKVALDTISKEGSRLAENVRNGSQLASDLEALKSASKNIQARFVTASQLANNLQYFYRLETESGIELIDLRQTTSGESTRAKGTTSSPGVGFAVSVKGSYPAILEFLRRLENGPHYCRVLTAGISGASPERDDTIALILSLELLGQP
jgi:hypothetical protein